MKTLNDAIVMRNTLLKNLEKALFARHGNAENSLTIVVVEVAQLALKFRECLLRCVKNILLKEYPELNTTASNIIWLMVPMLFYQP
jgi:NADH dehydrogenase